MHVGGLLASHLHALLDHAWQTRVNYVIGAYNDMARVDQDGSGLLIGIEAFIPPASPRPPGHIMLDVVHGLEGSVWYLVRHANATYDLHQVTATLPGIGTALVRHGSGGDAGDPTIVVPRAAP